MQLERLAKIGKSLLFSVALAGNIHVQALGNKPIALAPDGCGKWAFHIPILPHYREFARRYRLHGRNCVPFDKGVYRE